MIYDNAEYYAGFADPDYYPGPYECELTLYHIATCPCDTCTTDRFMRVNKAMAFNLPPDIEKEDVPDDSEFPW